MGSLKGKLANSTRGNASAARTRSVRGKEGRRVGHAAEEHTGVTVVRVTGQRVGQAVD